MARSLTTWIPFLLAFVLLAFFCIRHHSPIIQTDILDRSSRALAAAGIGGSANVNVDGLDVTLTGDVVSEAMKQKAEDVVVDLRGVRVVNNQLNVPQAAPVAVQPSPQTSPAAAITQHEFAAVFDGQEAVLTGMVKDAGVRASLVGFARQAFTNATVIDRLQVVPSTPADWEHIIKSTISQLAGFKTGKFDLRQDRALLYGSVADAGIKQDAIAGLRSVVGDNYDTRFDISVLAPTQQIIENCQAALNQLLDGQVIEFATGSDYISEDSFPLLETIAESLIRCEGVAVEIQGHTDSSGDDSVNLGLSQRRAASVLSHLADDGVDAQMLTAKGYGEALPIGDNTTRTGRARNRRIEFKTLGN